MATKGRDKILLKSTGLNKKGKKTGYSKVTKKNKRTMPEKLEKRCFDPMAWNPETGKCGMHVMFKESKF